MGLLCITGYKTIKEGGVRSDFKRQLMAGGVFTDLEVAPEELLFTAITGEVCLRITHPRLFQYTKMATKQTTTPATGITTATTRTPLT